MPVHDREHRAIFSAYAEVVPIPSTPGFRLIRILRVRGGSSADAEKAVLAMKYSPRTRR